jgi:phosphinothricin acetyltransferase
MVLIRDAVIDDMNEVNNIYNESVSNNTATFDTEPKTLESRIEWFKGRDISHHPVIVAEIDGKVVGWGSLNPFSDRKAYDLTAENSLYLYEKCRGVGIGKAMLAELIKKGNRAGLHTIIAKITEENLLSIKLHENHGFFTVGILKEVGVKFGRTLDVRIMQYIYPEEE